MMQPRILSVLHSLTEMLSYTSLCNREGTEFIVECYKQLLAFPFVFTHIFKFHSWELKLCCYASRWTNFMQDRKYLEQHSSLERNMPFISSTKITVFRNVMPCSLVEKYQRFEGTYCFHVQDRRVKNNITGFWNIMPCSLVPTLR